MTVWTTSTSVGAVIFNMWCVLSGFKPQIVIAFHCFVSRSWTQLGLRTVKLTNTTASKTNCMRDNLWGTACGEDAAVGVRQGFKYVSARLTIFLLGLSQFWQLFQRYKSIRSRSLVKEWQACVKTVIITVKDVDPSPSTGFCSEELSLTAVRSKPDSGSGGRAVTW